MLTLMATHLFIDLGVATSLITTRFVISQPAYNNTLHFALTFFDNHYENQPFFHFKNTPVLSPMASVKQHLLSEIILKLSVDDGSILMFGFSGNAQFKLLMYLISKTTVFYSTSKYNHIHVGDFHLSRSKHPIIACFLARRCYRVNTTALIMQANDLIFNSLVENKSISIICLKFVSKMETLHQLLTFVKLHWPNIVQLEFPDAIFGTQSPQKSNCFSFNLRKESFFEKITKTFDVVRFEYKRSWFGHAGDDYERKCLQTINLIVEKQREEWHITKMTAILKFLWHIDELRFTKIKCFAEPSKIQQAIECLQSGIDGTVHYSDDILKSDVSLNEYTATLQRYDFEVHRGAGGSYGKFKFCV